ncbi:hypothetical protein OQA88_5018 [Cercophora sp. LCS_1]
MPPVNRSKQQPQAQLNTKSEHRIEAAIEFALSLHQTLAADPSDAPLTNSLVEDAKQHIKSLHSVSQTGYHPNFSGDPEVDALATRLWNSCTRLRREYTGQDEARLRKLVLHGRVLAFHLLAVARARSGNDPRKVNVGKMVGLIKLGLKSVRDCLDGKELEMAMPVLARVADFKGVLQNEGGEVECLEVEYFILRTMMSWMEGRLDVAEHMFVKGERLTKHLTPDYAERLADVLFEIGTGASREEDFAMGIKWLERANAILNGQNLEDLSKEGAELRMAILQALVTALLGTGKAENLEQARNYVDSIEDEVGGKLVVLLLRLELLEKTPAEVFDSDAYAQIIRRMVREFDYSEAGFKLIIYHIRKLHDKSPATGCLVLDDFIMALTKGECDERMEKAVVTRMWMITNQRDTVNTIDAVHGLLSHLTRPLSAEAAVAAQALVWKKLEANFAQGQFDLAEAWCRLALHSLFKNCGSGNVAKLERKLLLCELSRNSNDAAATVIQNMSPTSLKEPMTAYLAFKLAVRTDDRELAERCLRTIALAPDHVDYLGACIAEAHRVGDIFSAIAALKKLERNFEYKEPNSINLPALFRCTIRLLGTLIGREDVDEDKFVETMCEEFETVILALEKQKQEPVASKVFNILELEWFARNSYSIALNNTTKWDLRFVIRMLTSCVKIITHFTSDAGSPLSELSQKSLFARFIISSALVSLARTHDSVDRQRRDYMALRAHIAAFDTELVENAPNFDEDLKDELGRKCATLLVFDFEAAVALEQWDDLGGIVQRASHSLYSTMRKLINEIWTLESFDAMKLAKYTRCLFQATLPLDDGLAMKLLDEACSKARELHEADGSWPEEEMEWMATTAFNHAIDCFSAHHMEKSKEWAAKAIDLAHYCGDEGGLERSLQDRHLRLNLDGGMR